MGVVLAELARGGELAGATDFVQRVSVDAGGAGSSRTRAASAVGPALLALSADVAETSRARLHTLVREDDSGVADADSVAGVGTCGAGSDAGSTDEVEPGDAGGADSRSSAAGVAGVGAVVADSVDGDGLRVGAGGAEEETAAGLALGVAADAETSVDGGCS